MAGTRVFDFNATDGDGSSPNKDIFYLIKSGANDQFEVDASTGQLKTSSSLDRERTASYTVVVLAIDKGVPPRTGTATLTITVNDINDVAPTFPIPEVALTKEEGITGEVYTFNATDPDLNADLRYSINWTMSRGFRPAEEPITPETLRRAFRIDNSSGLITVNRELDREQLESAKLVVMVQDLHEHTPGQTATGTVSITVQDIDDNPPVFSVTHVQASVEENWPNGMPISLPEITVTDKDKVIAEGTVNTSLHGECTVNLNITNVNDFTPVFQTSLYNKTVPEDIIIGTSLLTVKAIDGDQAGTDNARITYSLAASHWSRNFRVNHTTGLLSVHSPLDYENSGPSVVLIVRATDHGTPQKTGENITTVNANDADGSIPNNDIFYVITKGSDDKFTINSKTGLISTVSSLDREQKAAYNLESAFRIDSSSGLITVNRRLDREKLESANLIVVVQDLHAVTSGQTATGTVSITVQDIDDNPPVFSVSHMQASVEENWPHGMPISLPEITVTDKDKVIAEGAVNTSLHGECIVNLNITNVNDFTPSFQKSLYNKTVPEDIIIGTSVLTVKDENDETPVFTNRTFYADVWENSVHDTYVVTLHATDDDASSPNNVVFFGLESGGADNFRVNSTSGVVTVGPGAVLDRETDAGFNLIVLALDRGDPPRSSNATVSISLLDVNDKPPSFVSARKEVSIYENSSVSTSVWQMTAEDKDTDPLLVYSLLLNDSQAATDRDASVSMEVVWNWFTINPSDGTVSVNGVLDREKAEVVILKIMVNDTNGESPQTDDATLTITLLDVNDNSPDIAGNRNLRVSEALAVGTEVTSLTATDLDRDQTVTFHMLDAVSNFTISEDGKISLLHALDRETQPSLNFTVMATDSGTPPMSTNMTITVEVTDANDNDPEFNNDHYSFNVSEHADNQTVVATMTAIDRDEGDNALVTFDFGENVNDFSIDQTTGEISVKRKLDRETIPSYTIGVVAIDNPRTEERRRTAKQITITVTDYNDNPPTFDNIDPSKDSYEGIITELAAIGERLTNINPGAIECSDLDTGENKELSFELLSLDNVTLFSMDEGTGFVYVNASLVGYGFETYNYTVTVTDHGVPSLSSTANLTIRVLDNNINRPQFVDNFSEPIIIPECFPVNTRITTLTADDADRDKTTNGLVEYRLEDGVSGSGDSTFFTINPNSGDLSLARHLNREEQWEFALMITASDHGEPQLSSTVNVIILVNDTNDNSPTFNVTHFFFSVAENDVNVVVGTVLAEDPDENKRTCYALAGESSDFFKIDANDAQEGVITLIKPLDRETIGQERISLTVTATDCTPFANLCGPDREGQKIEQSVATVDITVTDVNDNPPTFISPRLTKGFIATADYRHLIVNLQEYVSDNDTAPNRVHGFYSVSPPERDEGLEANDAVKQLDKPLELTTNGTVRTNAKFPADSQGFFTWHVMANDTGGTGNVTLRIYVVGEEKLIRITFFHSEEELRKTQDQVMKDLQDMTGLEFVADDLQEVLDSSGKPDPTRSALMVHAVDDKGEFKDADELQNFLDHQIEVTRHLKAQYQLLTIECSL
nr:hypothetical protein BaRGS_023137 [Batillaria attramentaria]